MKLLPLLLIAGLSAGCSTGDSGSPESVRSSEWTQHWDCGYGFIAANPEGTQQLVVESLGGATVPNPGTVELPSPEWRVYVQIGRHFGERAYTEDHACTDLARAEDPEPEVDEEWDIVDGTLTIEAEPLVVEVPGTANLAAEGLVVETSEGEQLTLDPITVVSECWGCFAG